MLEKYLHIHPEVQKAIAFGEPIVALDSSFISHGLSYPENIEHANNMCTIIRDNRVVPATIAIINGILKVGLIQDELEFLAINKNIIRANKKDLPFMISKKLTGTFTIDATIMLANLAGIKIITTYQTEKFYMDTQEINNFENLHELANTEVVVVYSEVKSSLDIGLTLDPLENKNVTVIEYNTDNANDLHTRKKIFKIDYKAHSSLEIAKALQVKWDLNLNGGVLITNATNNVKLACEIAKDLSMLYKMK